MVQKEYPELKRIDEKNCRWCGMPMNNNHGMLLHKDCKNLARKDLMVKYQEQKEIPGTFIYDITHKFFEV